MTSEPAAPARPPRPPLRLVDVVRVDRITPQMVRVTVSGEALADFPTQGPAEHFKVSVPPPGLREPVLPAEGQGRPVTRTYTPRRYNRRTATLEVDFFVHGDDDHAGPASSWAARAQRGDRIAIGGPRGAYVPGADADWYVLAGDESALPAIGTIVEALPAAARALVLVEVSDAAEEQALQSRASVDLTWLHRKSDDAVAGRLLAQTLRELTLPSGSGRIWLACEASVMRDIRRHLLRERGLDGGVLHTQGYWKAGEANHPDHDRGEDV